jgi:hypothetical protein
MTLMAIGMWRSKLSLLVSGFQLMSEALSLLLEVKDLNHPNTHATSSFQNEETTSSITTEVVSSNPAHGEVYSIRHYGIKFVRKPTVTI